MKCDAIYWFDRASVLFAFYPKGGDGPRIVGEIAEDALRDFFGAEGGGDSLVEACIDHFDLIEEAALEHYRHDPRKPVTLTVSGFESSFATHP